MRLLIFSSITGNTRTFADFITENIDIEVGDFNSDITKYDKIVLGAYTWGNGKIPRDIKKFLIENKDNWKGKKIFLFGSGHTLYPKFCGAVDGMKKILEDCGAEVVGFFKFEQRFLPENYNERFLNRMIERIR